MYGNLPPDLQVFFEECYNFALKTMLIGAQPEDILSALIAAAQHRAKYHKKKPAAYEHHATRAFTLAADYVRIRKRRLI